MGYVRGRGIIEQSSMDYVIKVEHGRWGTLEELVERDGVEGDVAQW